MYCNSSDGKDATPPLPSAVVLQKSNGPELRRSVRKRNVRMTEPTSTTEQSEDFEQNVCKEKKGKKRKNRLRVGS